MKHTLTALAVAGLVAGCAAELPPPEQNLPKTVFDAGKTQISVLSVVPWSAVKDGLKPKFATSGETALSLAVPTTSAFEDHLIDAVKVAAGIGLPTSGVNEEKKTDLATGDVTGQKTQERAPGEAPKLLQTTGDADELRGLLRVAEGRRGHAHEAAQGKTLRRGQANSVHRDPVRV